MKSCHENPKKSHSLASCSRARLCSAESTTTWPQIVAYQSVLDCTCADLLQFAKVARFVDQDYAIRILDRRILAPRCLSLRPWLFFALPIQALDCSLDCDKIDYENSCECSEALVILVGGGNSCSEILRLHDYSFRSCSISLALVYMHDTGAKCLQEQTCCARAPNPHGYFYLSR